MKRSDMLIQLIHLLVLAKNNSLGYKDLANEMLSLVESRGMCPVSVDHNGILTSMDWEPEDGN